MASFFGKAATTTTKVRPDARVEAILKNVANLSQNMNVGGFIDRQVAGFTPAQQEALQQMKDSNYLNQVQNTYQPRTQVGLGQLSEINQRLQNLASSGVTPDQIEQYRQSVTGGQTAGMANRQAANVSLGGGPANDATRRAALTGMQRQQAMTNLNRNQAANVAGIQTLQGNRQFEQGMLGQQANIAGKNVSMGAIAPQVAQQRMSNLLTAGNQQQQMQNNINQNNWENTMGRQKFGWDQLNNQLNVLNTISPMAGYTMKQKGSAPSIGQQIGGAAIAGVGAAANRYFAGQQANQALQGQLDQATPEQRNDWFNSINSGKQVDSIGGIPVYAAKDAAANNGFWGTIGNTFNGILNGFNPD